MDNEDYKKGHQAGLVKVLKFLGTMESRYKQWAASNPGLTGNIQDGVKGKLEAVMTAKRAVEKMKLH